MHNTSANDSQHKKKIELTALGIYNEWFRQASEIERQDIEKFMDYYTEKTGLIK